MLIQKFLIDFESRFHDQKNLRYPKIRDLICRVLIPKDGFRWVSLSCLLMVFSFEIRCLKLSPRVFVQPTKLLEQFACALDSTSLFFTFGK
jgi:hypothetical protein